MSTLDVVQRYFDAWNQHNPSEIVACFTEEGVYRDPFVPQGLAGDALADYARRFFSALPDARFDIVSEAEADNGRAFVEWLLVAGSSISLPGVDILVVEGDALRSVQGYFDRKTVNQQMGADNWSNRVSSDTPTKPGAISLTWIEFRPEDIEREQTARYGPRIGQELMQQPGILTWMTAGIGGRWFTITAWEDVESLEKAMGNNAPHKEAMRQFFSADFGQSVHTSIWLPHRLGPIWVRCPSCKRVSDYHRVEGKCPCGEALPPQPPYW